MIAHTVHKTTFMCMMDVRHKYSVHAAEQHAIQLLSYNALHISLVPALHDHLLQRLLQYEPVLGIAVACISLDVPVIPLRSLLQFFDGAVVQSGDDLAAIREFVHDCIRKAMFVNTHKPTGQQGPPMHAPTCYISSPGDWANAEPEFRGKVYTGNVQEKPSDELIMEHICKKLFRIHGKVLVGNAFCKNTWSLQRCFTAAGKTYDLRNFFGGMSQFHNTRSLFQVLGVSLANRFPDNFESGSVSDADGIMRVSMLTSDTYCLSFRIWDLLLWASIMRRPRRDPGVLSDISHTFIQYIIQGCVPESLMPYDDFLTCRYDQCTGSISSISMFPDEPRPESLIRFKVCACFFRVFVHVQFLT